MVGAVLVGGLLGAASANAATYGLHGGLRISWQGDPARGCVASGQCGVSGSMFIDSGGGFGSNPLPLELSDSAAIVRTRTIGSGGAERDCTDALSVDVAYVLARQSGSVRARLDVNNSLSAPSSGRCPGPIGRDLLAATLPFRRVGRDGFDLRGRQTFGAGPFRITETSTVEVLRGAPPFSNGLSISVGGGASGPGRPPAVRRVRVEFVEAEYVVSPAAGALNVSFGGGAEPSCEVFGACGLGGELSVTGLHLAVRRVTFIAEHHVNALRSPRRALFDLHAGRLPVTSTLGGGSLLGTVQSSVHPPAGPACADRADGAALPLDSSLRGGVERVTVDDAASSPNMLGFITDPLRTRCGGPANGDVVGSGMLAEGAIPLATLGARRLTLTLRSHGTFVGPGYGGTRGGAVTLTFTRARLQAGSRSVEIFPGEGLP